MVKKKKKKGKQAGGGNTDFNFSSQKSKVSKEEF